MQTFMSFFGEFICLLMFFVQTRYNQEAIDSYTRRKEEAEEKGLVPKYSKFKVAVPAMCDFFSSTLQFAGLILISSSIYQMLKGGTIILTAIFSVLFLKRKLKSYHYIGIILTVMGVTVVGLSSFIVSGEDDDQDSDYRNRFIGLALVLISLVFNGFMYVSEESLLNKYYIEPFELVGWEGFWGVVLYTIAIPVLNLIPCPYDPKGYENDLCAGDHIEDFPLFVKEATYSW